MKKYKFEIYATQSVVVEAETLEEARMDLINENLSERIDTQDWVVSDGIELEDK